MGKKATPNYIFRTSSDSLSISLVGYQGGIKHTYGREVLPADCTQAEKVDAVAKLRALLVAPPSTLELTGGE